MTDYNIVHKCFGHGVRNYCKYLPCAHLEACALNLNIGNLRKLATEELPQYLVHENYIVRELATTIIRERLEDHGKD